MKHRTRASIVMVACIGAGSMAVAGVGVGLAAGQAGTVTGCVAKSGGALRIVHSTHACTSHERPLTFNIKGPRGARGLRGPQGPSGPTPATFQMYANVDGEGHLGSHYGATSATNFDTGTYIVTFDRPIGQCAIIAVAGKAGGTDEPHTDVAVVQPNDLGVNPDPVHQALVGFAGLNGFGDNTPFMLTMTCPS
jgi:hypothetical protein